VHRIRAIICYSEIILEAQRKKKRQLLRGAVFMAQNMPFANRIVILVNIYGELFTHKITLTHTHKKFKYFGKNFDFNPKPLGMLTGCAVLNSNKPIKRKIAWVRKHALTIYNN
jgi:hypothetical protein